MRRFVTALASAVAFAAVGTSAFEQTAQAQEIQLTGPLAGAPAVRKLRLYRQGRFEIAPAVAFTLLDEYERSVIVGAKLQYNITDWIAIGVWGGYGINFDTDLTSQVDQVALRNSRTAVNLNHGNQTSPGNFEKRPFGDQVAQIQWVANPQIQLTPFRGKLALFQALFIDTDAYIHAGFAAVGLNERPDCGGSGQTACTDPKSFVRGSRIAPAPTFGIGLDFWVADLVSIGVEYRAIPFSWNRGGFDAAGGPPNGNFPDNKVDGHDQTFKFNQMLTLSVGFMLGSRKTSD